MKLQFAAMPLLFASFSPCLLAADVLWTKQSGLGLHISGNAQGALWVIGIDEVVEGNYSIHQYGGPSGHDWVRQPGSGRRLAVDPSGDVWMVNAQNRIFRYRTSTREWDLLPGLGQDVAVGGDGSVWVIGVGPVAGGFGVFKWNGSGWTEFGGGAVRIAAERDGTPWVVNDAGTVYRYNTPARSWEQKRTKGRSVHAGTGTGAVWVLDADPIAGGYRIQQWNRANGTWEPFGTSGAVSITEAQGTPWIVQADGGIHKATTQVTSLGTGTITVTDSLMPPMILANVPFVVQSGAVGKMLCSAVDGGSIDYCGDTKADYVGEYALNTVCSSGFYDPIYGGSCWKCPADTDQKGSWLRSADSVEKDTACWRAPKESLSKANKTKSPGWPWECPSGSFWDGYSPDGLGGSCWQCPAAYPRRTGNAVYSDQACATPVNETKPATLVKFNGCPEPKAVDMGLPGKRTPGKPFLDIAAGWSQGVAAGGCYACPIIDEGGNFMITARNASPIYNKESNAGCRVNFKWQPPQFVEPGLSGLTGVKEVIWENRLFEQDKITSSLYFQAKATSGKDASAETKRVWVAGRWQQIAVRPYNTDAFRVHIFALLKTAVAKSPGLRTPGEQMLIKAFENYIVRRRTYLAEQALAMYDAWKKYSDDARSSRYSSQLETAFYYGTVPLDFNAMLSSAIAAGGVGTSLIGSMVAAHNFALNVGEGAVVGAERADSLFAIMGGPLKNLATTATGLSAISGATLIQTAFAILTSIAMDQFMEIQTARPRLEASVALAKQSVSLDELTKISDDLLYYYWAKAMDTADQEDSQVVAVASAAHAVAQGKGYKEP